MPKNNDYHIRYFSPLARRLARAGAILSGKPTGEFIEIAIVEKWERMKKNGEVQSDEAIKTRT